MQPRSAVELPDDPVTLALMLGVLLLLATLGSIPAVTRALQILELEHKLGKAFWPWLVGIDTRASRLPQLPPHEES